MLTAPKLAPPTVTEPKPKTMKLSGSSAARDSPPVTIRPRYIAPMIELFAGSLTKYVPTIEVITQTAPISSGKSIAPARPASGKVMAASTIVATMVTA